MITKFVLELKSTRVGIDIEIQYQYWIEIFKYIDRYWNIEISWKVLVGLWKRLKFSVYYNMCYVSIQFVFKSNLIKIWWKLIQNNHEIRKNSSSNSIFWYWYWTFQYRYWNLKLISINIETSKFNPSSKIYIFFYFTKIFCDPYYEVSVRVGSSEFMNS